METTTRPTVRIYVRLGAGDDDSSRNISFRIPEGLDPMELLDRGIALDGNQALLTVAEVRGQDQYGNQVQPFEAAFASPLGAGDTFAEALADTQRNLVTLLRERGFEPQFA